MVTPEAVSKVTFPAPSVCKTCPAVPSAVGKSKALLTFKLVTVTFPLLSMLIPSESPSFDKELPPNWIFVVAVWFPKSSPAAPINVLNT